LSFTAAAIHFKLTTGLSIGGTADRKLTISSGTPIVIPLVNTVSNGKNTSAKKKQNKHTGTNLYSNGATAANDLLVDENHRVNRTRKKTTNTILEPLSDGSTELSVFCAEVALPVESIQCEFCLNYYHMSCCSQETAVDSYESMFKLIGLFGWTCRACRATSAPNLDNLKRTISDLTRELKQLRVSLPLAVHSMASRVLTSTSVFDEPLTVAHVQHSLISAVSQDNATATSTAQSRAPAITNTITYSEAVKLLTKTITESDRRKYNVIVSGLPELNS